MGIVAGLLDGLFQRRVEGIGFDRYSVVVVGCVAAMNRLLSVVRSRTDKIIELSRAALTVPRYGESNRLVGVD